MNEAQIIARIKHDIDMWKKILDNPNYHSKPQLTIARKRLAHYNKQLKKWQK